MAELGWILLGVFLTVAALAVALGVRRSSLRRTDDPGAGAPGPELVEPAHAPAAGDPVERAMANIRANLLLALDNLPQERRDRPEAVDLERAIGAATELTLQLLRLRNRLYPAVPATAAGPGERAGRKGVTTGSETILVVDDEEAIRSLVRRALERFGYTVFEAAHPIDALRLLEESGDAVDLVVTDVMMPDMNGVELVQQVRERWPLVRVLYISGAAQPEVARDAARQGLILLPKPFTMEQLAGAVRAALDALPDARDVSPETLRAMS